MMKHFLFAVTLCCLSGLAQAQIYKCSMRAEGVTKTVYTDAPCAKHAKQTVTDIQAKSQRQAEIATQNLAELDQAVTKAVLAGDLTRAKSLAVTKQHWRLIAIAQGEHTLQAAPEPAPVLASSHVSHCERATTDYEAIANAGWREADQIATKREVMYAACGVSPPTQPAIVGVGGIGRSVWYPQGFYAPRPPHAGYGGHWNAYRGGNWSGQSGGLNVYYRGKHGGVVINSGARSGFNGSYAYR